jgi:transposase-like protein
VIPFFAFAPAIRKIIYTTNAIESLNRVIRKSIYAALSGCSSLSATVEKMVPPVASWKTSGRHRCEAQLSHSKQQS